MTMLKQAVAVCSFLAAAAPAQAASSDWFESEGGRVRLVTTGDPAADGTLKAALQIDVAPGWKTYWRDPGDAGVPPQITFAASSGITATEVGYPVPKRFDDGVSHWAGYEWPVSLALTLHVPPGTQLNKLEADVFLGLCQSICIPVQAKLTVDAGSGGDTMFDRAVVNAAFDSVPDKASSGFGVRSAVIEGNLLVVEAQAPSPENLTLFLAGDGAFQFGEPKRLDGGTRFAAPILSRPKAASTAAIIAYTLSTGEEAVDGAFTLR